MPQSNILLPIKNIWIGSLIYGAMMCLLPAIAAQDIPPTEIDPIDEEVKFDTESFEYLSQDTENLEYPSQDTENLEYLSRDIESFEYLPRDPESFEHLSQVTESFECLSQEEKNIRLFKAAECGDLHTAQLLLNSHADVNATNSTGIPYLPDSFIDFIASFVGLDHFSKREKEQFYNEPNLSITPIDVAALNNQNKMIWLLLNANPTNPTTAWPYAAFQGHIATIQWLLKQNMVTDIQKVSLILHATYQGHAEIIKLLLHNNKTIKIPKELGSDYLSPFQLAAHCGNPEILQLLLEHECVLFDCTHERNTIQCVADTLPRLPTDIVTIIATYKGTNSYKPKTKTGLLSQLFSIVTAPLFSTIKTPENASTPIPSVTDKTNKEKTALMFAQQGLEREEDPEKQNKFRQCIALLEEQPAHIMHALAKQVFSNNK